MKTTNTDPLARPRDVEYTYDDGRPRLTITHTGGRELGRCYYASYYHVESDRALSMEDLLALRSLGFFMNGQDFMASQVIGDKRTRVPETFGPDGAFSKRSEVPYSVHTKVPCVMRSRSTGQVIPGVALNPYSGEPYPPQDSGYYVYHVEARVDSSD